MATGKPNDPVVHDPATDAGDLPTKEEQVYRFGGNISGAAIFGGAVAAYFVLPVIAGAFMGGILGVVLSVYAATHVHTRKA
jgi:hypothetical protein